MARPYILITKTVLLEIEELHAKGVPISKLRRDYFLKIASPTLQRLIAHATLYKACEENSKGKAQHAKFHNPKLNPVSIALPTPSIVQRQAVYWRVKQPCQI